MVALIRLSPVAVTKTVHLISFGRIRALNGHIPGGIRSFTDRRGQAASRVGHQRGVKRVAHSQSAALTQKTAFDSFHIYQRVRSIGCRVGLPVSFVPTVRSAGDPVALFGPLRGYRD
jgi:hypothetical protein